MTTQTRREQVEAVLTAAGFVDDDHGDWVRRGVGVYLDIAHAPPETAWVRPGPGQRKELVTYDEVIRRFS